MFQGIKDYAKCVARNKFVISGGIAVGLSVLTKYIEHATGNQIPIVGNLLYYSGFMTLGSTYLGLETFKAYKRMKKHIKKHGIIDPRFKDKFSNLYCTQLGIKIAAKEEGLEERV
ncbi:hypothetical protein GOV14_01255 [Candidatus Pacearchaeota archaeon]|nr:hypothetical protein [Candidatus Pacearchaeota archaeon]